MGVCWWLWVVEKKTLSPSWCFPRISWTVQVIQHNTIPYSLSDLVVQEDCTVQVIVESCDHIYEATVDVVVPHHLPQAIMPDMIQSLKVMNYAQQCFFYTFLLVYTSTNISFPFPFSLFSRPSVSLYWVTDQSDCSVDLAESQVVLFEKIGWSRIGSTLLVITYFPNGTLDPLWALGLCRTPCDLWRKLLLPLPPAVFVHPCLPVGVGHVVQKAGVWLELVIKQFLTALPSFKDLCLICKKRPILIFNNLRSSFRMSRAANLPPTVALNIADISGPWSF